MSARGFFAPDSYAETVGRDVPASFASSSCVSWARLRASEIRSAAVLMVRILDGSIVGLSESLLQILQASAGELAEGHSVTLVASEVVLSPAEAADLLGLSRPFVVRLLDDGRFPRITSRRVGIAGFC